MEFNGSWSLDSEESGFEQMQSGINARAIDFAKFGRLYLKNGGWTGRQVIPAAWVSESTQEDRSVDRAAYYSQNPHMDEYQFFLGNGYYKYFWWGYRQDEGISDFFASGHLGQIIYISPQADLIIVRNGERSYPKIWDAMHQFACAMREYRRLEL